jgi:ribose 5-phosphate isomerase B
MKIALASDHGGFSLKELLKASLLEAGHDIEDLGTHSSARVDYPDFAHDAAKRITSGSATRAILVCGTGVGMAIAANRHAGIRAVNCSDVFTARMSRSHNDANILCLGERVVGPGLAREIVDVWLASTFEGARHVSRIEKIELLT